MGINITQTMNSFQFENRENLRNAANDILKKQGASNETLNNIVNKTIFDSNGQIYSNSQLAIIKASAQVSMNKSLKETLRYLKSHAAEKVTKKPVLGEIWEAFSNTSAEDNNQNELLEFVIDTSVENIFAAA